MIEALLYLLSIAEATKKGDNHGHPLPNLQIGGNVVFAVDATYIVNILLGRMMARENIEIIQLMKHLWQQAKLYYKMNIVWVKGHSGACWKWFGGPLGGVGWDGGRQGHMVEEIFSIK